MADPNELHPAPFVTRAEAKEAGTLAFMGTPCKNCGGTKRYASDGHCIPCSFAKVYRRREKRITETNGAKIFVGDPCRVCGGRDRNVGDGACTACKRKRSLARYYETRDEYAQRQRRNRKKDPEKARQLGRDFTKKNPAASRAKWQRRRALKFQNRGEHTGEDIDGLYKKQKGKCMICFVKFKNNKYHIDHVVPLSRGGGNGPDNLQLLCQSCNIKKGAIDPFDYARKIGLLL